MRQLEMMKTESAVRAWPKVRSEEIDYRQDENFFPGPSDPTLEFKPSASASAEHFWTSVRPGSQASSATGPLSENGLPLGLVGRDPENLMGRYLARLIWTLLDFDHWLCRGAGLVLYEGILDSIEVWVGDDCCVRYDMDHFLRTRLPNTVCPRATEADREALRKWGDWVAKWRAACRRGTIREEFEVERPMLRFPRRRPQTTWRPFAMSFDPSGDDFWTREYLQNPRD
jgi:hypothetical protein